MKAATILFSISLIACAPARADLGDLIEIARNQAEVQKDFKSETDSYARVKSAYDGGMLTKGRAASDIALRYGNPVVRLKDRQSGLDKWIYKKATESFFGGEQIYLLFDDRGLLVRAEFRAKDKK